MTKPNNFSELLDPNHPDPYYEGYHDKIAALDEGETVAGMDPVAFQKLGRRERIAMTGDEYSAMDDVAAAIKIAASEAGEVTPPEFIIKELNPENHDERYGKIAMLGEDDYSLVFGKNEIFVTDRQTHDTGNEADPDYAFLANSMSSGEWYGLERWGNLSKRNLVRKNVVFAKTDAKLDPRTNFINGTISLPVIQDKPEMTERLVRAVNKTNAMLTQLSGHPAMQEVLEKHKHMKVGRTADAEIDQVRGDVSKDEMKKYALMRTVSEGVVTAAQSLAAIMADSPIKADIKVVGQKAVEGHWIESIARGAPEGITGPFSISGIVPKGGLLEGTAEDPQFASDFRDELAQNIRRRTKEVDLKLAAIKTMAMGEVATETLTQGQHDALVELASMAHRKHIFSQIEHLMETGCPAGAHGKSKNEGLITVATKMLVDNLED